MRNSQSNNKCFCRHPLITTNRKLLSRLILLVVATAGATVFLVFSRPASAVNRTWDGGGVDNNWTTAANWSDDGPGVADIAVFDGTSTKDATIDAPFNVAGIQINAGYSGTITQAAGLAYSRCQRFQPGRRHVQRWR